MFDLPAFNQQVVRRELLDPLQNWVFQTCPAFPTALFQRTQRIQRLQLFVLSAIDEASEQFHLWRAKTCVPNNWYFYTKRPRGLRTFSCEHVFFDGQKLNWNIIETLVGGFTTVVLMSPTKTRAITERFSRNMNCLCILQKLGKFIIWLRAFIDCFPATSTSFLLGSWLFPHQTSGTMSHDSQIANGPEISPPRKWMDSH